MSWERLGRVLREGCVESSFFFFLAFSKCYHGLDITGWRRLQERTGTAYSAQAQGEHTPLQHLASDAPEENNLGDSGITAHEVNSEVIWASQISSYFVILLTFVHVYVLFPQSDCKFFEDRWL